jgi:elongation factor G
MIQGQEMRGNATVINAMAPLANMFGYEKRLHALSAGLATITIQFDHFAPVDPTPPDDLFPLAVGMRARA